MQEAPQGHPLSLLLVHLHSTVLLLSLWKQTPPGLWAAGEEETSKK